MFFLSLQNKIVLHLALVIHFIIHAEEIGPPRSKVCVEEMSANEMAPSYLGTDWTLLPAGMQCQNGQGLQLLLHLSNASL